MSKIHKNIRTIEFCTRGVNNLPSIDITYNRGLLDWVFGRPGKVLSFTLVDYRWRSGLNFRTLNKNEKILVKAILAEMGDQSETSDVS